MTKFEFTCLECTQSFEVNDGMRRAILENGCPVCTATAEQDFFEEAE